MITWLWPGDSPWPVLRTSKSQGSKPWTFAFLSGSNPWHNLTYFTCKSATETDTTDQLQIAFCCNEIPLRSWGPECQWWHSGVQQKYHSGLPESKRLFSLVRKWQRITSQEVPRADLQGNVISLTSTLVPSPKATTIDENTGTSLWSTSKSDWQKAAGRMPVCHFEPMGQQTGFHHKKHF